MRQVEYRRRLEELGMQRAESSSSSRTMQAVPCLTGLRSNVKRPRLVRFHFQCFKDDRREFVIEQGVFAVNSFAGRGFTWNNWFDTQRIAGASWDTTSFGVLCISRLHCCSCASLYDGSREYVFEEAFGYFFLL